MTTRAAIIASRVNLLLERVGVHLYADRIIREHCGLAAESLLRRASALRKAATLVELAESALDLALSSRK